MAEWIPSSLSLSQWTLKSWIGASSLIFGSTFLTSYALFAAKKLPLEAARVVGRIAFWPTLPGLFISNRLRNGSNWWSKIDDMVYLGAVPLVSMGHVDTMYQMGIRAVVNLCDEYEGPVEEYKKKGILQLRLPTVDHFEPSLEDLIKGANFIKERKEQGESVYIHCRAGHGRGASVAFCYLLAEKKMTLEETQKTISKYRVIRPKLWKQKNINNFYFTVVHPNNNSTSS